MNLDDKIEWLESCGRLTMMQRWMSEPDGEQIAIFSSRNGNYAHRGIGNTREESLDDVFSDIRNELTKILFPHRMGISPF